MKPWTALPPASVFHPATNNSTLPLARFQLAVPVVLCVVVVMLVGLSHGQTPSGPVPARFFGMTFAGGNAVSEYPNLPSGLASSIGNMGKESAAEWAYIEPYAPGSSEAASCTMSNASGTIIGSHCYFWSASGGRGLDGYVSTAASHNLRFTFFYTEAPPWATGGSGCRGITLYDGASGQACGGPIVSSHLADQAAFVSNLVARYNGSNSHGLVNSIELFNEEDYKGTVAEKAAEADNMVKAIKSASSTVLIGGIGKDHPDGWYCQGCEFDQFWTAWGAINGNSRHLDFLSYHGYPHTCCIYPEILAIGNGTYGTGVGSCQYTGYASCIREAITRNGVTTFSGGTPFLLDTEGSWGTAPPVGWFTSSTEPAFISRFLLLGWSSGVSEQFWSYPDGGSIYGQLDGIANNISAYQETANWIRGSTMTHACALVAGSANIWTCTLSNNGTLYEAVWNTSGSSSLSIPAGTWTSYKDLSGSTTTLSANATSVSIGTAPILLIGTAGSQPSPPTALSAIVN